MATRRVAGGSEGIPMATLQTPHLPGFLKIPVKACSGVRACFRRDDFGQKQPSRRDSRRPPEGWQRGLGGHPRNPDGGPLKTPYFVGIPRNPDEIKPCWRDVITRTCFGRPGTDDETVKPLLWKT